MDPAVIWTVAITSLVSGVIGVLITLATIGAKLGRRLDLLDRDVSALLTLAQQIGGLQTGQAINAAKIAGLEDDHRELTERVTRHHENSRLHGGMRERRV